MRTISLYMNALFSFRDQKTKSNSPCPGTFGLLPSRLALRRYAPKPSVSLVPELMLGNQHNQRDISDRINAIKFHGVRQ